MFRDLDLLILFPFRPYRVQLMPAQSSCQARMWRCGKVLYLGRRQKLHALFLQGKDNGLQLLDHALERWVLGMSK